MLRLADKPFIVVREEALRLMCEEEASVIEMRQVEKATSGLSGPVGGSVSYVSVGDMEFSSIDTVVSGVNDHVCGDSLAMTAGEFDVCACDSDSSVMTADEFDVCACDSDSSAMAAGELDVCACDRFVSDGAGDSSGADVVDDVVACGDDTLLHDVVRVGGWLSMVGDTLMCGAGVARSDRRDAETVVGLGVAQPGWVDGLVCADDSLRPEPPLMYAMCLCRSLQLGHGDCLCL